MNSLLVFEIATSLEEDFIDCLLEFPLTDSRKKHIFRKPEYQKLSKENVESPQIRHYDFQNSSGTLQNFGWGFKMISTWKKQKNQSSQNLTPFTK